MNVADSLEIGENMTTEFRASLPIGFHSTISSPIKTMEHINNGVKVGDTTIFDLDAIFLRLLTIGQRRHMELAPIFQYELCPVPPSLIDEYGTLRKGSKAPLVHSLCVKTNPTLLPDVTIVDVSRLLYHIVWPHRGDASVIVASISTRLSTLAGDKVLVFDKYYDVSAKDHDRMRRAGIGFISYDLTNNTPLPSRYVIMKNKHNKLQLSNILSTYDFGKGVTVESRSDGVFAHDEADITMISYLLMAAEFGTRVIRILSDDTDVFVLLVYWVDSDQEYRRDIFELIFTEHVLDLLGDNAICSSIDTINHCTCILLGG